MNGRKEVRKVGERLIELRKMLSLNQEAFGKPLNLSRSAVASYEVGRRSLTDRTIADICRVYSINEEWLRTGNGEMFVNDKLRDVELSALVADLINSDDEWIKECVIHFLKLSPQSKERFKNFLSDLLGNEGA